jgi:hypothetical protein
MVLQTITKPEASQSVRSIRRDRTVRNALHVSFFEASQKVKALLLGLAPMDLVRGWPEKLDISRQETINLGKDNPY